MHGNIYTDTHGLQYHTRRSSFLFDTLAGRLITKGLEKLSKSFDLDFTFGTAPHDFTLSRYVLPSNCLVIRSPPIFDSAPYPSNDSLLSLFATEALPAALAVNNSRASIPNVILTNSGSQRFDIFAGAFTKNDQLTASPFADAFLYIANVTAGVANKVLPSLNHAGANERRELERRSEMYARGEVEHVYREWIRDMASERYAVERRAAGNATLGYVTTDVSIWFSVLFGRY